MHYLEIYVIDYLKELSRSNTDTYFTHAALVGVVGLDVLLVPH